MPVEERGINNSLYRITENTCLAYSARVSFYRSIGNLYCYWDFPFARERELTAFLKYMHLYLFKAFALIRIFKDVDNSFSNCLLYVETC